MEDSTADVDTDAEDQHHTIHDQQVSHFLSRPYTNRIIFVCYNCPFTASFVLGPRT